MLGQLAGSYPFWFIDPHLQVRKKLAFGFGLDFVGNTVLAAGDTAQLPVAISSDADFVIACQQAQVTTDDDVSQLAYAPILVQMSYGGSGRNFFDNPVPLGNVFGSGERPFTWPAPYHLVGGGQLLVQLQNLDLANDLNVRLTFTGWKTFPDIVPGFKEAADTPGLLSRGVQALLHRFGRG